MGFMKTLLLGVLIALAASLPGMAAQPSNEEMQATGEAWLAIIDHGKYSEGWRAASAGFRSQVTEDLWGKAMTNAREPLGAASTRKLLRVPFAKSLPGTPDGEYAVVLFQTAFAKKADSVETLTFALEEGKWKCAGYFIR